MGAVSSQRIAGRFKVERILGEGGMARVLLAIHEELDLPVAIKVLKASPSGTASAMPLERLRREARAVAQLRSGHAVRVIDTGEDPEVGRFIVMEYVDGPTLAQILATEGPLSVGRAVDLILQVCDAIIEAHLKGIIHRDIKPPNILLSRTPDGREVAKVTDFGIAKASWDLRSLTESSAFLGSPKYMSPEQLVDPQRVDERTDVWALGVVLFEMLTGRLPFAAYTPGAMLAAVINDAPDDVRSIRPSLPADLSASVMRCLVRRREERTPTVERLATELRAARSLLREAEVAPTEPPPTLVDPPRELMISPDRDPTLEPHSVGSDPPRAPPPLKRHLVGGAVAMGIVLVSALIVLRTRANAHAMTPIEPPPDVRPVVSVTTAEAPAPPPTSAVRAETEPSTIAEDKHPPTIAKRPESKPAPPSPPVTASAEAKAKAPTFVDLGPRK